MFKFLKKMKSPQTFLLNQKQIDQLQDTKNFTDVTRSATSSVDIGPYVKAIPNSHYDGLKLDGVYAVGHVYRTSENTYDLVHILTDYKDVFLVIAVDLEKEKIIGHYVMDFNKLYGIDSTH